MIVSRLTTGQWIIGESPDAVWFDTDVPSIEAARKRYSRSGGLPIDNKWPKLEKGMYLIPADELSLSLVGPHNYTEHASTSVTPVNIIPSITSE